jgi:hypothetical protein
MCEMIINVRFVAQSALQYVSSLVLNANIGQL